jgi:hypothetical protein
MVSLVALWLPILLAAVLVFVVSSIIHMVFSYHRSDVRDVPNEAAVMDALRPFDIAPGDYMVPRAASPEAMKSPEFQEKLAQGPVVLMTVMPKGPVAMGKSLTLWFLYSVVVGLFAAYVASRALPAGADYLAVFRFAGVTAFAGYGLALVQDAIWWNRSWTTTVKSLFDALVYALVTGGTFGWLWPGA